MTWAKREAVTNLVVLGEDEGQRRKVGGLLVGTPRDRTYPDKVNYELVQKDGEVILLSGSASLGRQINEHDIGKFVKCEFTGWGKSANGKFKIIDVNVWEGEPNADMKAWPRYAEFQKAKTNGHPLKEAAISALELDQMADEEDDLPF